MPGSQPGLGRPEHLPGHNSWHVAGTSQLGVPRGQYGSTALLGACRAFCAGISTVKTWRAGYESAENCQRYHEDYEFL